MIRVGPAGWSYKDWAGIVYPAKKPKGFDPLEYLARFFDTVEINSSFYGAPRSAAAKKWAASIAANPRFLFTAKLSQSFTHKRAAVGADEREFKEGVAPLVEAGRLGALLLQFPWSFRFEATNRQYLLNLARQFADYPLVLEVRHVSWATPEVLELLAELGIGLANIDQPLFHRSIRPGAEVTAATGYVRLHGRNYRNWFREKADVAERYDYLYKVEELEPWVTRIQAVAEKAPETFVVTNNHYLGKAVVNALEISSILEGGRIAAPKELIGTYPELQAFTSAR